MQKVAHWDDRRRPFGLFRGARKQAFLKRTHFRAACLGPLESGARVGVRPQKAAYCATSRLKQNEGFSLALQRFAFCFNLDVVRPNKLS